MISTKLTSTWQDMEIAKVSNKSINVRIGLHKITDATKILNLKLSQVRTKITQKIYNSLVRLYGKYSRFKFDTFWKWVIEVFREQLTMLTIREHYETLTVIHKNNPWFRADTRAVDPSNMGRWSRLVRWTSVAESCTQVRLTRSGLACLSFPSLSCLGVSPSRRVEVLRCVRLVTGGVSIIGGRYLDVVTWWRLGGASQSRMSLRAPSPLLHDGSPVWILFFVPSFYLARCSWHLSSLVGVAGIISRYPPSMLSGRKQPPPFHPLDRLFCAFCLFSFHALDGSFYVLACLARLEISRYKHPAFLL